MREASAPPSPTVPVSMGFRVGLAMAGLVLVALSLHVASLEWFSRDDFRFLAYVQSPEDWSWRRAFLPFDERFWTFYRPLSMETFFWVGHRLFGLNAGGYFALSLGLHFASAGLVFRVARQLGFDPRTAAATALLAVSRPGSLGEIYYGSVFMYVSQVFFGLVCITGFLDHLRRGRLRAQVVSCLGLVLALLCNEAAVATPVLAIFAAVATGRVGGRADLARLLWASAPQFAVAMVYLAFRFLWIAPVEAPVLYRPALGPHVAGNVLCLLARVFGGGAGLLLAAALGASAAFGAAVAGGSETRRFMLTAGLACAGWLATALAPFAVLPFPQGRWAMPLAVPAVFLLGVALEGAWRSFGGPRPRGFEAALLALVLASLPYATLAAAAADPVGAQPRRIVEWMEAQEPPLAEGAVLVLFYGAPGLASTEAGERFRYLSFGGGVLNAVDPGTRRVMRFQDLSRRPARNTLRAGSVYLLLQRDLRLQRAAPDFLDTHLRRGF